MPILPTAILPKNILSVIKRQAAPITVSPVLLDASGGQREDAIRLLQTTPAGLTQEEAQRRLEEYGHNVIAQEQHSTKPALFAKAMQLDLRLHHVPGDALSIQLLGQ